MLPFLQIHALAAARGDGLRPELRILLERLAAAPEATDTSPLATGMDVIHFSVAIVSSEESSEGVILSFDRTTVQTSRKPAR